MAVLLLLISTSWRCSDARNELMLAAILLQDGSIAMRTRFLPLFVMSLVVLPVFDASAAPIRRPDGGTCDSTGTTTRNGTDQDGNRVSCTWDYCTYSDCSTSGGSINSCVRKTTYSNPRNCQAASSRPNISRPGINLPMTRSPN